MRSATEPSA
uniref:Uncharacterized protein n=1 Tax=Anguilla anguilla TaxID=7936 RepID=A0A0E9R7H6_ANGAN